MDRPTLQEQLDACRTAADAAGDPLLRELEAALASDPQLNAALESQLQTDRRIASELSQIEVPADLREKLTLAFREGAARSANENITTRSASESIVTRSVSEGGAAKADRDALQPPSPKPRLSPKKRYGRPVFAAFLAVSAAILLFAFWPRSTAPSEIALGETEFSKQAIALCTRDAAWTSFDAPGAPTPPWQERSLPLVGDQRPLKWRTENSPSLGECLLWELNASPGQRVYLVSIATPWKPGLLPQSPSKTPRVSSGGWSAGAWRKDAVAYALVVEGTAKQFRAQLEDTNLAFSH